MTLDKQTGWLWFAADGRQAPYKDKIQNKYLPFVQIP